jgi:hypothetical protein
LLGGGQREGNFKKMEKLIKFFEAWDQ